MQNKLLTNKTNNQWYDHVVRSLVWVKPNPCKHWVRMSCSVRWHWGEEVSYRDFVLDERSLSGFVSQVSIRVRVHVRWRPAHFLLSRGFWALDMVVTAAKWGEDATCNTGRGWASWIEILLQVAHWCTLTHMHGDMVWCTYPINVSVVMNPWCIFFHLNRPARGWTTTRYGNNKQNASDQSLKSSKENQFRTVCISQHQFSPRFRSGPALWISLGHTRSGKCWKKKIGSEEC